MSTLNPTATTSNFIGNNDFVWWLGTVLNADDSEAKLGRVKVSILGFHKRSEKPENLPWAHVLSPGDSAGSNGVGSAGNQLKPGSFVVGFFLDYPDCQQPVIIGTLLGKITEVNSYQSQEYYDRPAGFENVISSDSESSDTGQAKYFSGQNGSTSPTVLAENAAQSEANPSGVIQNLPAADGKNGGSKTLFLNISYALNNISTTISQLRVVQPNTSLTLTADIDSQTQVIPVSDATKLPDIGALRIGSEIILYNRRNSAKIGLVKRGALGTTAVAHNRGATLTFIPKSEVIGGDSSTAQKGDVMGVFTNNLLNIQSIIDKNLELIRNAIWWLVNEIKSYLLNEISKVLNSIGTAAISSVPMYGKLLTDIVIFLMKELDCILDESLFDAIFSGIEAAIDEFVNQALSALDTVSCVFDSIFSTVFELIELANTVVDLVNEILESFSSIGDISGISDLSSVNVTSILSFAFNLLGIGCNRTTRDPFSLDFSSCFTATPSNCGPFGSFDVSLQGIPGKWNPEYSKMMGTVSENGSLFVIDDTPYSSRVEVRHGPSKSGFTIYENGDIRVTNSSGKVSVTIKDETVVINGNYTLNVDGDYRLKVGRDYHLEVAGMYNLICNRESKVTYSGEHNTIYKTNAILKSNNGFAITSSKIGLSASGQLEIHSPIVSSFTTEQNHFATGSYNLTCLNRNTYVAMNNTKLIGGNNLYARAGTNVEQGIGTSIRNQTGAESEWWGGTHNQVGTGVWSENKLSIDQESVFGISSFTRDAASFETISGSSFKSTVGILNQNSEGLLFNNSTSILRLNAPIISIN